MTCKDCAIHKQCSSPSKSYKYEKFKDFDWIYYCNSYKPRRLGYRVEYMGHRAVQDYRGNVYVLALCGDQEFFCFFTRPKRWVSKRRLKRYIKQWLKKMKGE